MTAQLPPLKNFILPGGCRVACLSHLCRTVCRRAERTCVQLHWEESSHPLILAYLNRMSDYFFVLSRYSNDRQKVNDILWKKG